MLEDAAPGEERRFRVWTAVPPEHFLVSHGVEAPRGSGEKKADRPTLNQDVVLLRPERLVVHTEAVLSRQLRGQQARAPRTESHRGSAAHPTDQEDNKHGLH